MKRKQKKNLCLSWELVDQHEAAPLCPQKDSKQNSSNAALNFCPKEPLNRSRNPIPVWRKSQIFRLHLTDYFVPFNFRIRAFGKLQSCSPLINFTAQLESSRLDIWAQSYAENTNWCVGWNPNPNWTWIWCKFPLIPCSSWT